MFFVLVNLVAMYSVVAPSFAHVVGTFKFTWIRITYIDFRLFEISDFLNILLEKTCKTGIISCRNL